MKLFLLMCLVFFTGCQAVWGQTLLSEFRPEKVRCKSICKFIIQQQHAGLVYFEDFSPSVTALTDTSKFDSNTHVFSSGRQLPETWNVYLTAHPAEIWQGHTVSFGMIYDRETQKLIYTEDAFPGIKPGQLFFIEMKVFCGLVHFPVCFLITGINEKEHEIRFSYVESGQSKGAQAIRLTGTSESTSIIHSSIHQTRNKFRDHTLYPIYHRKAIAEVHKNVKKQIPYPSL